jgi:hypothetical protein
VDGIIGLDLLGRNEGGMGRLQTTQVKLPGVRLFGPETVATVFLTDGPAAGQLPVIDGHLGVASL